MGSSWPSWRAYPCPVQAATLPRPFMQGLPERNEVALTFDDGPHPLYTPCAGDPK